MRALFACFAAAALFPLGVSGETLCRVLDPELAGTYQGGCKDGLAEGDGEAKGAAEYRGGFHAGRKQGKGVKIWPSGDRYEGEFVADRKEGTGKYTWGARGPSAGESYDGAWLNDLRHGYGVYAWPSGDRYAGEWVDDAITGMPTPMMIARARAKTETLIAVAKPGVKVCRALTVGIAVRDWIRGEVTAVDAARIEVRIDDPGRQPHVIDARPLVKGMSFWSDAAEWRPCI
ncbi:MAG: hypothetical protein Q8K85_24450 [Hyphomicrobium sp.]|nr:hypothetical protein [Hyphomicrobium sp.]